MKYKVGDRVIVSIKERGIFCEVGTIVDIFDIEYLIGFENGYSHWVKEKNITLLEENKEDLEHKYYNFDKYNTIKLDDYLDSSKYLRDVKGEWNNMNNFEKILEIYRERKIDLINEEHNNIIDEFLMKDKIEKIKDDVVSKALKDCPDFKEMIDIELTVKPTDKAEKEVIDIAVKAKHMAYTTLDELLKEVKAQLSLAETYEQKIDILVRYEILDKKTKKIAI